MPLLEVQKEQIIDNFVATKLPKKAFACNLVRDV